MQDSAVEDDAVGVVVTVEIVFFWFGQNTGRDFAEIRAVRTRRFDLFERHVERGLTGLRQLTQLVIALALLAFPV